MKHNRPTSTLVMLAAASVLLGGCAKEPDAQRSADGPLSDRKEQKQAAQKHAEPKPADTAATVAPTLSAYEEIRATLAADDISGATAQAQTLASAATTAEADAPEALRGHLSNTAKAAEALSGTPTDDANAVRKAFGEVSRSVVALIGTDPSLQESAHVFECSMAQGYQKWVQRTETIENPYMGQSMLACGSKATWDG